MSKIEVLTDIDCLQIFLDYVKVVEQLPRLLRSGEPITANHEVTFLLESVLPNLLREIPMLYGAHGHRSSIGMKQQVNHQITLTL